MASLFVRAFLVLFMVSTSLLSQHLTATAKFDNGPTILFNITNFENQNSGGGNISSIDGQSVNIAIQRVRSADNSVQITIDGSLAATLKDASQNSTSGTATLNDPNQSSGNWERKL
jgi:hypothetical protein